MPVSWGAEKGLGSKPKVGWLLDTQLAASDVNDCGPRQKQQPCCLPFMECVPWAGLCLTFIECVPWAGLCAPHSLCMVRLTNTHSSSVNHGPLCGIQI